MTMTTPRSRRWFLGAMAAAAAAPPFLASAQTERPNPGNRGKGDTTPTALQGAPSDIYTSPALGMEVTWSSPWFERERSAADSFATMGEESITLNADGMYGFVGIYGIDPTRDAPTPSGLLDVYEGLMEQKLADLNGPPTTVALHQRLESSLTVLFVIETGNGPSVDSGSCACLRGRLRDLFAGVQRLRTPRLLTPRRAASRSTVAPRTPCSGRRHSRRGKPARHRTDHHDGSILHRALLDQPGVRHAGHWEAPGRRPEGECRQGV